MLSGFDHVTVVVHDLEAAVACYTALLGRAPSRLDEGLAVTPPRPLLDTGVRLAAPVELGLRLSLAFLWIYTAAVSAWLPERSGVLELLARCGLTGACSIT